MENSEIKKKLKLFCSDYFFHYAVIHSENFQTALCRFLSGNPFIQSASLDHCDLYGEYGVPKMFMDISMRDEMKGRYNIEFQNYECDDREMARFQLYIMQALLEEFKTKKNYNLIAPFHQLIINSGKPIDYLSHAHHLLQLADLKYGELLKSGLIKVKILQLKNMEELDMETIQELRQAGLYDAMHLFFDEKAHQQPQKDKLSKELIDLFNQYVDEGHYLEYFASELDRILIKEKIEDGVAKGVKQGLAQGIEQGIEQGLQQGFEQGIINEQARFLEKEITRAKRVIIEKYHVHDLEWVNQCSEEQLDILLEILYTDMSYEEIKAMILFR